MKIRCCESEQKKRKNFHLSIFFVVFQLYIKARGLDHVRFSSLVKHGAEINLNKLREILTSLKMPTVTKNPVHLEISVQVEGKTILFFFLNQQSFNALIEGDSKHTLLISYKISIIVYIVIFFFK